MIKAGRGESGQRATLSHTGSLAGSDAVYDTAFRQCGALRVTSAEEMFDLCRALTGLPSLTGRRVAVVTNSGGPSILAADKAEAVGLIVAEPGPAVKAKLVDIPARTRRAQESDRLDRGRDGKGVSRDAEGLVRAAEDAREEGCYGQGETSASVSRHRAGPVRCRGGDQHRAALPGFAAHRPGDHRRGAHDGQADRDELPARGRDGRMPSPTCTRTAS